MGDRSPTLNGGYSQPEKVVLLSFAGSDLSSVQGAGPILRRRDVNKICNIIDRIVWRQFRRSFWYVPESDCQDALQEAWCSVLQSDAIGQCDNAGEFAAYLYVSARNALYKIHHKWNGRRVVCNDIIGVDNSGEQIVVIKMTYEEIRRFVCRQWGEGVWLLVESRAEGFTFDDIKEGSGLPPNRLTHPEFAKLRERSTSTLCRLYKKVVEAIRLRFALPPSPAVRTMVVIFEIFD